MYLVILKLSRLLEVISRVYALLVAGRISGIELSFSGKRDTIHNLETSHFRDFFSNQKTLLLNFTNFFDFQSDAN